MSSFDVVIVGAGVVGCSTAYELAQRGLRALIIERDAIGDHASGFAFGGLTAFNPALPAGPEYPLAREALRLHRELAPALLAASGVDNELREAPYFALATDPQQANALQANLAWLRSEGYVAEWLDADTLRQYEPRFSDRVLGASRIEGSSILESYKHTLGLAQAAERGGAEIRHGEVLGLVVAGGRVQGVRTARESVPCERVVLANGPWIATASEWLGFAVPVRPLKGQIVRLRLPGAQLAGRFAWGGSYFASKADGMVWAGTTEEEAGFDARISEAARDEILTDLAELFPPLLDAEIVMQTACLRPYSEDGLPIVDQAPGLEGLYVATGGGRRGMLFSSLMGRAVADLIATGRSGYDLGPFALGRFGRSARPQPS